MTARALRVGVLIDGNLVEERLFLGSEPVTIGQSVRCALSVPVDGLPVTHTLFVRDQGQTLLRVADGMDARLAAADGAIERVTGTVAVPRGGRGKLSLGAATILFQDIAAPPIAPRPRLPASVRGTLADRIDPRLATIVGASVVVHLAIATWAWLVDREIEPGPVASTARPYQQDVYEDVTLPDPLPEPTAPTAEPGEVGVAAPATPRQTPRPAVPKDPLMTTRDADRYAQILTGTDETPAGTTAMRNRAPAADLHQQIRDIRDENRHVRVGGESPTRDGGERLGTGPRTNIDGPELARLPAHRDEPTGGRITPVPTTPPRPGDPLAAVVLAKISSTYLPGLQRCYKKGLVKDEALGGKIAIAFTVDPHGRLTDPEASGLTGEVDACVKGFMTTWRFPFPRDRDGQPAEASYSLALVLRPS